MVCLAKAHQSLTGCVLLTQLELLGASVSLPVNEGNSVAANLNLQAQACKTHVLLNLFQISLILSWACWDGKKLHFLMQYPLRLKGGRKAGGRQPS